MLITICTLHGNISSSLNSTLIEHSFQKSGTFSLPAVFYLFSDKYRAHYATLHSLSTIDGSSRTTFSG